MKKILTMICMCLLLVGCTNSVWSDYNKQMIINKCEIDKSTPIKVCKYVVETPFGGNMIFYIKDCPLNAGDIVKLTKVEENNDKVKN